MIRTILKYGDEILHTPAAPVEAITPEIERLIDDMVSTMYAVPGIGLAAPQIGVPLRVIVVDLSVGRDRNGLITLVNPEFVEREGAQHEEEGCLSVPGFNVTVERPTRVVLRGLDRTGTPVQHEGTDLLARAFQHEMDHLDGTLFVDRLRGIKRELIVRRIKKLVRSGEMVTAGPLRIAFFGTPAFALPTLDALLTSRHTIVCAVAQPDRPSGRGRRTNDGPVKARALAAGVPVLQPTALKDPSFVTALGTLEPDLGVVAAYGRILPESVLATPRLGMVNVHASLLPRYRGAAPVHRAVIAGETETGVTIMQVVKALDAGPILAAARRPIGPDETSADVDRALAAMGATLLSSVLDDVASGSVSAAAQDEGDATYAPPLRKDEGAIDWARTPAAIHNLIRGLHPWPHAFTFLDGKRIVLLRSAVPGVPAAAPPGTVTSAQGDELRIATGAGALDLIEVQPEGKRPMSVRDFLAGHRLAAGDCLTVQ